MNMNGAIFAFCALYNLATCGPDEVAKTVIDHLGAPYDQIVWCCATFAKWDTIKPHTRLCDRDVNMSEPGWGDGIGSIKMSSAPGDYCAIWLHRGAAPTS